MKKFEGVLFCTDLDGTLYRDDKTVSKENLEAIEYFKAEGGYFTFITGRAPETSGEICGIIKPNVPYGVLNGGGIYSPFENRYLWRTFLPADAVELVREVDLQLPEMGIQVNTQKEIYFNKDNSAMELFRRITGLPNVYCHYEDVEEPVLKVVFGDLEESRIEALAKLLNSHPKADDFNFIRSERILYEILPKGVCKGAALQKLAGLLGVEEKRTIAVGNYNNDISMIKAAGIGFAVANAVDEVKAAADHITVSNNDHAISVIIDALDRGGYAL